MEAWLTKVLALIVTLVSTLIAGLLPIKLLSCLRSENDHGGPSRFGLKASVVLSTLNCFSGGVFLAVTMIHLLPDVRHDFQGIFRTIQQETDFPMAEFVACLGFFLVMLIENIIIQYQRSWSPTKVSVESNGNCTVIVDSTSVEESQPIVDSQSDGSDTGRESDNGTETGRRRDRGDGSSSNNTHRSSGYGSVGHCNHNDIQQQEQHQHTRRLYSSLDNESHSSHAADDSSRRHRHMRTGNGSVARYESVPTSVPADEPIPDVPQQRHRNLSQEGLTGLVVDDETMHKHGGGHSHEHSRGVVMDTDGQIHSLRSLVLLIALSIHTIFEGMALGLQDSTGQVLTLFIAIIVHKLIMAFTVGLRFIESLGSIRTTVLYVFIFSITSPIGIGIGLLVSEIGSNGLVTVIISAALQGVATGTFLYVTFFEVLLDEMTNNQNCGKVLAIVFGFTCITLIELFGEHGD